MRRSPARALLARVTSRVLCVTLLAQTFPIPAAGERIEWVAAPDSWEQPAEDPGVAPPAPPAIEDLLADSPPDAEAAPPQPPAAPSGDRPVSSTAPEAAAAPAAAETRSLPPARAPDRIIQPALTPGEMPPLPPGASPAAVLTSSSSFVPGWNLASVQNEPVDKSPAAVFSSIAGQLTRVFAYDACTPGDPWKLYDPANAAASDLTVVDQKIGFWIEMTAPAAVPNPGTLADETTIHLCLGWNLIGFPAAQARPVQTALASIAGRYSRVFGYDPTDATDPWEAFGVAVPAWANDLQVLQPGRGYWILATAEIDLTIANVGDEPTVAITAPADLAVVTSPTDITGTVTSDRLQSWTLSYRAHGEAQATVFATGNTPVVNGRLGTFDPTLLLNGGYTVELTATDFNGQSSTVSVDVNVEGQQKIGNFTLSFLDLEIPLSGLPIQVVRTYDSRDKRRGDFGIGWTLELRQGSYRNNRKPGEGWQITSGFLPCQTIQETRGHVTTVRLSDQEVYRFGLRLASPAPTLGGCFAQARFDFVDGTVPGATLAILGNTEVIYQNGTDYVVDSGSLEMYEPEQVRLTTSDGRVFDLDLQQGVTRLQDLSGNTLAITPGGISHSSGLSVAFQRDNLGRITSITDPDGQSLAYTYDAAGDLVSVTDRGSNVTRFAYQGNHNLLDIQDPLGRTPIRNEYDASGRLIRTIDSSGRTIELDHRLGNREELITDRLGHTRLLKYDARGNVVRELNANGEETRRTFDADDNLLSLTDPLGNTTSYTYDTNGNLTSVTDPEGNRTSYTYNSRGQVLTVLDPRGKLTKSSYDDQGRLLTVTDPLGNVVSYTYDARGNLLSQTDAEGNRTEFQVDNRGRVVSETDALGHTTTYTYDTSGRRLTRSTTRTTVQGTETLTWSYAYDNLGRLTRTTDPDGTTTETVYDALGQVTERIDKKDRRTTYTYDNQGRLLETVYPDGTKETSTYDAEGRRLSETDRARRTTTYTYDSVGRLLTTSFEGATVTNVYDAAGRLIETRDARNNATRYEYDDAGRRTKVIDALGHAATFAYDTAGNQVAITDARGSTSRFEYDDANRQVRVLYPDGTSRATSYDKVGRRTSETDPAGNITRFAYDARGRLLTVTDALNQITRYAYDEVGRRISQTDANGHETRFEHDQLGRETKRILPGGAAEIFTYDEAGNRIRRTDFNGAITNYSYDINDRLLTRSYPDGTSVQFTYTPTGQRETATDARGITTYVYDNRDQLTALTYPDGRELRFTYDPQGNRTSTTAVAGGRTLTTTYTYDVLNRLETVIDPAGKAYVHAYDANGNRAGLSYPNGVATSYTYDALNRLRTLVSAHAVSGVVQSYSYTLGPSGNRTRVEEHDGTVRDFGYDSLYRLTLERISRAGATVAQNAFSYDPVGNRLRQERSTAGAANTIDYGYDDRDRLLTEGGTTYGWNANGSLTSKSGAAGGIYTWDYEDRLIRAELADGTVVEHAYDADGNRVRTRITPPTGPPQITDYLVDPQHDLASAGRTLVLSQVIAETDANGGLTSFYIRGDDLLAVLRPAAGPVPFVARYYHTDGLGSIRALTDDAGTVTDRYEFEAFGTLLAHQGQDPNAYLFAGESLDPNTGFYFLRARWLDTGVARFASSDPFDGFNTDPISLHRYTYVGNGPVDRVDPLGLFFSVPQVVVVVAVGAVLGAISTPVANYALGKPTTIRDVATGAAVGAAIALGAFYSPAIAAGALAYGVVSSLGLAVEVFLTDTSTPGQKAAAGALLLASIVGGSMGYRYLESVRYGRAPVVANRLLGSRSVANFIKFMEQNGIEVVGTEVYVRTPFQVIGRRYDVIIRNPATGELAAIEIKGTPGAFARFLKAQFASDTYVRQYGGVTFGEAARIAGIEGQTIRVVYKILWE